MKQVDVSPFDVPCNGCTLCCHGDAVRLLPGDDAAKWKTVPHDRFDGQLMLAHKQNGDCYYLGDSGCTIQDDKPLMCREMDCRLIAAALTYTQARKIHGFPIAVWRRGRDLMKEKA